MLPPTLLPSSRLPTLAKLPLRPLVLTQKGVGLRIKVWGVGRHQADLAHHHRVSEIKGECVGTWRHFRCSIVFYFIFHVCVSCSIPSVWISLCHPHSDWFENLRNAQPCALLLPPPISIHSAPGEVNLVQARSEGGGVLHSYWKRKTTHTLNPSSHTLSDFFPKTSLPL